MHPDLTYRALAEKCLRTDKYTEIVVPESALTLLRYMYTDEEAEIVLALGDGMQSARAISKKVHRPVREVKPILDSLAKRTLIVGVGAKGFSMYGLLPLYPLLYDAQMLVGEKKMREEGDDGVWLREFARLFKDFLDEFYTWLAPQEVANRYQILGMPFGRIISVEQAVDSTPGLGVVAFPSDRYSEMVDRAKKSLCLVNVCTCRHGMELLGKGCGRSRNTCSTLGLPAEGAIKTGMGRRVSKEEFLDAKLQATEAGLVHMTENVVDPMIVCSCCNCCCEVMRILKKFHSPATFSQSRFEAVVDRAKCIGCGTCVKMCPMDAIALLEEPVKKDAKAGAGKKAAGRKGTAGKKAAAKKTATRRKARPKKAVVYYTRCIGCGVCVTQCDTSRAITLRERKIHRPPADNMAEMWARWYFEQKGQEGNLFPRLTLGATRLLSQVNPIHVTGPRAMSFKKD